MFLIGTVVYCCQENYLNMLFYLFPPLRVKGGGHLRCVVCGCAWIGCNLIVIVGMDAVVRLLIEREFGLGGSIQNFQLRLKNMK